ncbi:MAG: hypothetical protein ABI240_18535 [Sphingomonas sp.]
MDLLERYLHAVRWALPAARANDIIAELRDVLTSSMEDREQSLGRPLTAAETSALIKEFGHPLVVAARYRPQQSLIGPDVFPFYIFVMKIMVLVIVGIDIAVGVSRALFTAQNPVQILAQTTGSITMSLLVNVGVLTIIFAVMEHAGFPADHVRKWKPEQLPALTDKRKSAWEAALELGGGVAFLLWWTGLIHPPYWSNEGGFRIEPAAVFAQLYWPILALVAVRLVQNLIEWLRPHWKTARATLGALTTVGGLALLALIYRAGHWATIVSTGMPAQKAAELSASVNLALKIAIVATGAIWAWQGVLVVWRLVRDRQHAA